jgi:hypothetical protein
MHIAGTLYDGVDVPNCRVNIQRRKVLIKLRRVNYTSGMIARERAKEAYTSGDDRDQRGPSEPSGSVPTPTCAGADAIEKEW